MTQGLVALAILLVFVFGVDLSAEEKPSPEEYKRIAAEAEAHLHKHILKLWYPRSVDKERGGFIQDYAEDWTEKRDGNKTLVYQARLTWLAAQVAISFPELAKEYAEYSNHGIDFLADKMWDKENGGFFWSVDANGKATGERNNEKHVYGISFGLYAASVNYKATKNPKALELAKKTFEWLEKYAADGDSLGYFEAFDVKGQAIQMQGTAAQGSDLIGTRYGFKSMNSHIHLLESLTAYFEINPVAVVRHRLREVYRIVSEKIYSDTGCLHMFFDRQFKPVPDLDSFGHDIETAYLLVEAATALGEEKSAWKPATMLVIHALQMGWDEKRGGFYNEGSTFRKVFDKEKIWWVQAEGLNALLLMHEKHGSSDGYYWNTFMMQWNFIQKYQIDAKNGGWISTVGEDRHAKPGQIKSDQWKECYHQGRAVINVIERLRRMAK